MIINTEFPISNHPIATGYRRTVSVKGPFIDFKKQEITCPFTINHYIGETLAENYVKSIEASMVTNNQKFVNISGERVDVDIDGVPPDGAIPEFDFLFSYISNSQNTSLGNTIIELLAFMVARNDAYGNFNDLNNFNS